MKIIFIKHYSNLQKAYHCRFVKFVRKTTNLLFSLRLQFQYKSTKKYDKK